MAKFNMKDYENAMMEETAQDRLQEELENNRREEDSEAERNWRIWLEEQRAREYKEECDVSLLNFLTGLDDDYEDDYCDAGYDPYDDLLDAGVPCEEGSSLTAEDMYDMYMYQDMIESEGHCMDEIEDPFEDELYLDAIDPFYDNLTILIAQEADLAMWLNSLERKAVARNRHLNELKARRRAKQSANILERRYQTFTVGTDYEDFRLYSRKAAAVKKVSRVKTA